MITIDFLDDQRAKLWAKIDAIDKTVADSVAKLSQANKATLATVESKVEELKLLIEAVRTIADAKTPEDVQTASRAAQEVVKIKDAVVALSQETVEAKNSLGAAKKVFKQIQARDEASAKKLVAIDEAAAKVMSEHESVGVIVSKLETAKSNVETLLEKITTAAATATPNAQEIMNLKAKASTEFSEITAIGKKIPVLQQDLQTLKEKYNEVLEQSKDTLNNLETIQSDRLSKLYTENEARLTELTDRINGLLPGATSTALATAFDERKKAVEKYKWVWASLLILAVSGIVGFGCWFLTQEPSPQNLSNSLPIRLVVIAGLVMVEEFARRNFNVATRLAESYAYKEAISKSYLGFKNAMADVNMPSKDGSKVTQSVEVLVKTFLDKLDDEPGRKVFEKDRRVFGVLQAALRINAEEDAEKDPTEKVKAVAGIASAFTKVSWPLVALMAILMISVCVMTYILSK